MPLMEQETAIYLTNIVIAVILAGMLTHSWLVQGRTRPSFMWMAASWTMVVADCFFALRPEMPHWFGRLFPTLLVTVSHGMFFAGARTNARQHVPYAMLGGLVVVHAIILLVFLADLIPSTPWRMVANGVIWANIAFASFLSMRKAASPFWSPLFAPANVFLLHGFFHVGRLLLALGAAAYDWPRVAAALQVVGDLEASFFIVALFTALLIAMLQQRHEELLHARAEVETLSGLLPVCAWCKKVRDDRGYWEQVEDYLSRRHIQVTHGICVDCVAKQTATQPTSS